MYNLRTSLVTIKQLIGFGIAGSISTICYFITVNILIVESIKPVAASMFAYLFSVIVSYLLQSRIAFKVQSDPPLQVFKFVLIGIVGLSVSAGIMYLTHEVLHMDSFIGSILICITIPAANFIFLKIWVFK